MTEAEIYPLINEHFGSDKYHFGAMQYIRFARAIEKAIVRPAEPASGECLIVKGSGETDLPIVHIVHSLEEARHAVLSLMYSDPADAEDTETLFAEFEDELTDGNYWSIAFEIGGISVERACLDAGRVEAPTLYGYAYEWDYSPGVVHRSFDSAPYNGRQPDRTVEVFRALKDSP